ncbi:MAG: peptidoglycan recognition family protein, partial [Chloroflexota bacterium]
MRMKSVTLRPLAGALAAALIITAVAPMAPRPEPGPVKVRASETTHAVDGSQDFDVSPGSTHIAVHWLGNPDAVVTAAFSTDETAFSEPLEVEIEGASEAPDDASSEETYGALMGVDGIRVVRVAADRPLSQVSVLALDAAGPDPLPLGLGAQMAGATTMPGVIPRSGWGADESLRFDDAGDEQWPREYFPVQKLVVHHTAGRNADPDPAATVRAIYYYHAVTRRWADIGYNYLIDEAGRVYEGRYARDFWNGAIPSSDNPAGLGVAAGHTKYFNQGSMGIALLGTFTSQAPTPAARLSLVRMLAWASAKYGIDPQGSGMYVNPQSGHSQWSNNIGGHRDYASTSCPGGVVYSQLPSIRAEAAGRINAWPGQIFNPPRTLFFAAGSYVGRKFSSTGAVIGTKSYTLSTASSAPTDQSSTIPSQSGTWYHVTAGVWADYWVQASSGISLSGASPEPVLEAFETARPLSVPAGTYVGRKFSTYGDVTASRSSALTTTSTVWTTHKSTIPKQSGNWYYVTVGVWEGYWIPEAGGMSLGAPPPPYPAPIAIFNPPRTLSIAPGTYVGQRFSAYGISAGTYTATLGATTTAPTSRYSTLPGQSGNWYYIIDGVFESYWIHESAGTTLVGGPPTNPTTDFIFDSTGYFVPDTSGATYVALAPARLLDTRVGNGLAGKFNANAPRSFQVSGRGGVPANAVAVTGNLTVTNQTVAGAAFLGPAPLVAPASSTLN